MTGVQTCALPIWIQVQKLKRNHSSTEDREKVCVHIQLHSQIDRLFFFCFINKDSKGHLTATIWSKTQMGRVKGQKANGHPSKGKIGPPHKFFKKTYQIGDGKRLNTPTDEMLSRADQSDR